MTYVFWYLTKTIIFVWLIDRSVRNYQLLCICHKSNGVYPTVYCYSKCLYKCFYVCLYLYFHWRSKYREKRFGFQLKRLIPPPLCTCPKPGHVFRLVYVLVFSYVRWFEVKGRCSYCSCYLFSRNLVVKRWDSWPNSQVWQFRNIFMVVWHQRWPTFVATSVMVLF